MDVGTRYLRFWHQGAKTHYPTQTGTLSSVRPRTCTSQRATGLESRHGTGDARSAVLG